MDWLTTLITHESVARTVVLLGVSGVLFAGLVLGHLKLSFHHEVLDFVREFGLILFVYTLGLQIGPGFFGSLRAG